MPFRVQGQDTSPACGDFNVIKTQNRGESYESES
jgi:hypothetical protein